MAFVESIQSGPFTATAGQTAFPFSLSLASATEIEVSVNGAVVPQSAYSVTFGDVSGTVTFSAGMTGGEAVVIRSKPDFTQGTEFYSQGAYSLAAVNRNTRRSIIRDLALRDRSNRSVTVPPGETGAELPAAALRKGKVLGFNGLTGAFEVQGAGAFKGDPGGNVMAVGLLSQVPDQTIPTGTNQISVTGISAVGDAGAGMVLVYDPAVDAAYVAANPTTSQRDAAGRGFRMVRDRIFDAITYGAKADGVTDDWAAITRAVNAAVAAGGGTVMLTKAGTYRVSKPIEIKTGVVLAGVSKKCIIYKPGTATSAASGVAAVINASSVSDWSIRNLSIKGDRVKTAGVVTGVNFGIYGEFCANFTIDNVDVDYCVRGFEWNQCFLFTMTQPKALRCSSYGYRFYNSCTSFRLISPIAYACGGGFSVTTSIYGMFLNPVCENSDNGNLPGGADVDVFGDSGGDCYNPNYLYEIVGSQVTIVAPGGENNCSKLLYAEGAKIVMTVPHLFNTKTFNANWRLIELRGTSKSFVTIQEPHGFDDITQRVAASRAIFVENPAVQRLSITGLWRPTSFSGSLSVSGKGIVDPNSRRLVDMTQATMQVGGGTPFVKANAGDVAEVVFETGQKRLRLKATTSGTGRFSIPLGVNAGFFCLNASGTATGLGDVARFKLTEYNSSGGLIGDLYTFSASGGASPTISEWKYVSAGAGNTIYLDMPALSSSEEFKYSELTLDLVERQG